MRQSPWFKCCSTFHKLCEFLQNAASDVTKCIGNYKMCRHCQIIKKKTPEQNDRKSLVVLYLLTS